MWASQDVHFATGEPTGAGTVVVRGRIVAGDLSVTDRTTTSQFTADGDVRLAVADEAGCESCGKVRVTCGDACERCADFVERSTFDLQGEINDAGRY